MPLYSASTGRPLVFVRLGDASSSVDLGSWPVSQSQEDVLLLPKSLEIKEVDRLTSTSGTR